MPETCTAERSQAAVSRLVRPARENLGRPGISLRGRERTSEAPRSRCTVRLLQTARFGERLTNEWRRIETWTAWEQHGAEWLPVRRVAAKRMQIATAEKPRKPLLDKECRSRQTQSQPYLMSYIRHIYCRGNAGRGPALYDEMRA